MARKRQKLKHLDYNSKEYWNRLLAEDGLTLYAGMDKRLIYSPDLGKVESVLARNKTGKVVPRGYGPEGSPGQLDPM